MYVISLSSSSSLLLVVLVTSLPHVYVHWHFFRLLGAVVTLSIIATLVFFTVLVHSLWKYLFVIRNFIIIHFLFIFLVLSNFPLICNSLRTAASTLCAYFILSNWWFQVLVYHIWWWGIVRWGVCHVNISAVVYAMCVVLGVVIVEVRYLSTEDVIVWLELSKLI